MKLLGHESMTTSQRYVSGAGTENRAAAAQNPLYELIERPTSNNRQPLWLLPIRLRTYIMSG
jgi:hypothetical protein